MCCRLQASSLGWRCTAEKDIYVPRGWEHTHKLLKWLERLARSKLDVQLIEIFKVRGEGREMEGIVPLP